MLRVVRVRPYTWKYALLSLIGVLLLSGLSPSVVQASNYTDSPLTCSTVNSASLTADRPNAQSLLIVLLDRGATMGLNGGGADPNNFSASTADVLSDLWTGPMAVIPYQANRATPIGPEPASARADLKNAVNSTQSGGNAPLALAINQANALLQQQSIPAGSRIAIITDSADLAGSKDALSTAASTFGHEGVPVYTFNLSPSSSQQVQPLLQDVAQQTNGCYENITNSADLAPAVVSLYASWTGLEFTSIVYNQAKSDYPLTLDTTFNYAAFLTFYDSGAASTIFAVAGQQIPKVDRSGPNQHYELAALLVPLQTGVYTVTMNTSAVNARVYALTQSTRTLQLVQPTASTIAYTGQELPIEVHLVDPSGPIIPDATTVFQAQVTVTFGNATPLSEPSVPLYQQAGSDIAKGVFTVPAFGTPGNAPVRVGIVQISASSHDQGVTHTILVPLTIPVFIPKAPPCPTLQACVQQNIVGLLAIVLLVLILVAALIWFMLWRKALAPFGYLVKPDNRYVEPGKYRSAWKVLSSKSVIDVQEKAIRDKIPRLAGAPIVLAFRRDKDGRAQAYAVLKRGVNTSSVCIKNGGAEVSLDKGTREAALGDPSEIWIGEKVIATFQTRVPTDARQREYRR